MNGKPERVWPVHNNTQFGWFLRPQITIMCIHSFLSNILYNLLNFVYLVVVLWLQRHHYQILGKSKIFYQQYNTKLINFYLQELLNHRPSSPSFTFSSLCLSHLQHGFAPSGFWVLFYEYASKFLIEITVDR